MARLVLPCLGSLACTALIAASSGLATAAPHRGADHRRTVNVVSVRMPIQGRSVALGAQRPAALVASSPAAPTAPGVAVNTWKKTFTMTGATVHDVDFPTAKVGYAAAELGQVWKTTDGGRTWTEILNRGFPYYYYGVDALSADQLVISGFNNTTSEGIINWSTDGGATWSSDEVLSPNAWIGRIRLPHGRKHGLAMNGQGASGGAPNVAWYSDQPDQWTQVTPDPNGGWFGYQFTLLRDHSAYASGITYCSSTTTGATWSCRSSIDPVFDGATEFIDDQHGWVGGGEIAPEVAGWVHLTTDGGATWSGRVLETAWPVRQLEFVTPEIGWAAGGNIFSGVGGIYFTSDGGQTWSPDADTGNEVGACAHHLIKHGKSIRVWCIGASYTGTFDSHVYRTTIPAPARRSTH